MLGLLQHWVQKNKAPALVNIDGYSKGAYEINSIFKRAKVGDGFLRAQKILQLLSTIATTRCYWLAISLGGIALLAIALHSQYVNGQQPCTLCIQVRLWISLAVLVSLAMVVFRNNAIASISGQLLVVMIAAVLTERSWQLLGNERGFIVGECGFDLGLPAWFRIEDWFPLLYRIETTCGKTPEVLFGITMAEGLLALSVMVFFFSLAVLLASLINRRR